MSTSNIFTVNLLDDGNTMARIQSSKYRVEINIPKDYKINELELEVLFRPTKESTDDNNDYHLYVNHDDITDYYCNPYSECYILSYVRDSNGQWKYIHGNCD